MEIDRLSKNELVALLKEPPPNHNPLIGLLHIDTLINVYGAMAVIQELHLVENKVNSMSSPDLNCGTYFLISCIRDALKFEIDHRS